MLHAVCENSLLQGSRGSIAGDSGLLECETVVDVWVCHMSNGHVAFILTLSSPVGPLTLEDGSTKIL